MRRISHVVIYNSLLFFESSRTKVGVSTIVRVFGRSNASLGPTLRADRATSTETFERTSDVNKRESFDTKFNHCVVKEMLQFLQAYKDVIPRDTLLIVTKNLVELNLVYLRELIQLASHSIIVVD